MNRGTNMDHFIEFDKEKIELTKIFESADYSAMFEDLVSDCDKTESVYGPFKLPQADAKKPYLYGSFVTSIDGKIAYNESPDGTLIARTNVLDHEGGMCDYWILNLLRSVSDGSIVGAKTISKEPELTSLIYDKELQDQRIKEGLKSIPVHIITTKEGVDVPVNHQIFNSEIPYIIVTSPIGLENLKKSMKSSFDTLIYNEDQDFSNRKKNMVLVTGEGNMPNVSEAMTALRTLGLKRIIVESPMYLSLLMKAKMLDELFLNTSGIFIGGDALTISKYVESFTIDSHPHTKTMSIHTHSDHFFYTRYKMIYDK
jgi:riboflavin biosynthesis pyrimidine reductase